MKEYIEPACEVLNIELGKLICGSFDNVDSTEIFVVEDFENLF